MNRLFLLVLLCIGASALYAQSISDVIASVHFGRVDVHYQLSQSARTVAYISTDGGRYFNPLRGSLSGNILDHTRAGENLFTWDARKDFPDMSLDNVVIRVAIASDSKQPLIYANSQSIKIPLSSTGIDVSSFSSYAKTYVESSINEWQKRGEFEKTVDWQNRVNARTREEKIQQVIAEAERNYINDKKQNVTLNFALSQYDPDNEVFLLQEVALGNFLVPVPIADAPYFKANWDKKEITPSYFVDEDYLALASLDVKMPNGRIYTYSNQASLNYSIAEVEYHFEPIDIETTVSSQPRGQQTIQQKKISVGKSLVDIDIPQSSVRDNTNTFVLIIANENYKRVEDVPFAKNDGQTFKKYCVATLGMPIANVHYVENATLNDMRTEIAWIRLLTEAYKGEAKIIFYYAGHGIPDESDRTSYLLPVDGDGRFVSSGYKLDELYKALGEIPAKSVTVFMDACFSGVNRTDKMLASARGVAIKSKSGHPQGNMVVFSAAQGDETAYPHNEQGHGMFTYYLLKRLQETKGEVTLEDLGNYITTNVRQQSILLNGKSQTPSVIASDTVSSAWKNWTLK